MKNINVPSVAAELYKRIEDIRGRIFYPRRSPHRPIIGMYHGISELGDRKWGPWKYSVTPIELETHLDELISKYEFVSLDDLLEWVLTSRSLPSNSLVLTFDDGYKNFMTEALPILEQYNAPATVYVSTELAGAKLPFEHRLAQALERQNYISISLDEKTIERSLETEKDTVTVYKRLKRLGKDEPLEKREKILALIGANSSNESLMMSVRDIREAHNHPLITVGAHGHEHVPFASLSSDGQARNIENSKVWLSDTLNEPPYHFSFPYGSYDRTAIKEVHDAGFKSAVTTEQRCVSPRDWSRPYSLPRVDFSDPEAINSLTESTRTL